MSRVATTRVSDEVLDVVMAAIEREADLDGLVTSSCRRLSVLTCMSASTVNVATHRLADAGRLTIVEASFHRGEPLVLQLTDDEASS